jgi:hypothetical protein
MEMPQARQIRNCKQDIPLAVTIADAKLTQASMGWWAFLGAALAASARSYGRTGGFSGAMMRRASVVPFLIYWAALSVCVCLLWTATSFCTFAQVMTVTNDGVALNERILIRARGVSLRVPAGYLSPWPTKNMRNRMNEQKGIAFNFWMPDRRYVEIYPFSIVGFRPRERGRAQPGPDAYVVKVISLASIKADDPDYLSPEKAFKNTTSIPGISSYSFQQEDFGLMRFWRHDGPPPQPQALVRYRHMEGTDPQVLLRCRAPPREKPGVLPYPSCDGSVHFLADDLGFYLQFDRMNLPQWHAIVNAVRDLYMSWKAAPSTSD